MSLYCSGEGVKALNAGFIRLNAKCEKKEQCLRYKAFQDYKVDSSKTGMETGLWFVNVYDCIHDGYCDGVFPKKGGQR